MVYKSIDHRWSNNLKRIIYSFKINNTYNFGSLNGPYTIKDGGNQNYFYLNYEDSFGTGKIQFIIDIKKKLYR